MTEEQIQVVMNVISFLAERNIKEISEEDEHGSIVFLTNALKSVGLPLSLSDYFYDISCLTKKDR